MIPQYDNMNLEYCCLLYVNFYSDYDIYFVILTL